MAIAIAGIALVGSTLVGSTLAGSVIVGSTLDGSTLKGVRALHGDPIDAASSQPDGGARSPQHRSPCVSSPPQRTWARTCL